MASGEQASKHPPSQPAGAMTQAGRQNAELGRGAAWGPQQPGATRVGAPPGLFGILGAPRGRGRIGGGRRGSQKG